VLILTLGFGPGRGASAFQDFTPADPNYPFVKYLADRGVVKGYPDGTFRPAAPVTRAETAALLARALGLAVGPAPDAPTFSDLGPDHWAYPVVEAAARAGIFRGFPDGTFRPEEPVTRAQAAALLLRLTRAPTPAVSLPALEDLPPGHWAAPAVARALDAGLVHLAAPGRFAPEAPAGRLVLARGLATMLALRPESGPVALEGTLVPVAGTVWLQGPGGASTAVTAPVTVTAGHRVRTGRDGRAEVRFADGSGLRLDPDTEVYIKEGRGWTTILRDGRAGAVVDRLVLELPRGRLFGALASRYFYHAAAPGARAQALPGAVAGVVPGGAADFAPAEVPFGSIQDGVTPAAAGVEASTPDPPVGSPLSGALLAAARWPLAGATLAQYSEEELPWWKTAFEEKIRVEVDMPWGVAGIRGTFWMNEVTATRQTTSVLDGRAEVTAAGRTVTVESGQSAAITAPAAAPTPPAPMTAEERQAWSAVREWVEQRAAEIQERAPVVTPPPPVTEQAPPTAQRPGEVPPPPPPAPAAAAVLQNVIASLGQVPGAPAPSAPRPGGGGGGGGGAPAPPADTQPPVVVATDPADGATDVPVDKTVTVTFSEEVQPGAAYGEILLRDAAGNAVVVVKSISGRVLTLDPVSDLAPGTVYTVIIPAGALKDAAGNLLAQDHVFRFTTQAVASTGLAVEVVPHQDTVGQGEELALGIRVINVDQELYPAGLYAVDVVLSFDSTQLEPVLKEGKPELTLADAFKDGLVLFPHFQSGSHQIRLVVTLTGPPPQPPLVGDVRVATVRFLARGQGTTTVRVRPEALATVRDGTPQLMRGAASGECAVQIVGP
jgi:ferric-dicitrate binding protein FerR (iron transport regulator)